MSKRTVSGITLTLLLIGMLTLTFDITMASAETGEATNQIVTNPDGYTISGPVVYWTFEIINPNKGAVPDEAVYFKVRITIFPNSSSPLQTSSVHIHYHETGVIVVRKWIWDFEFPKVPIGETYEGLFGHFVLTTDVPIDCYERPRGCYVSGEMGVGVSNGTPSEMDLPFFLIIMPPLIVTTNVCPHTLYLNSKDKWITAYVELPYGYNIADIDVSTILLNNTIPIDPAFTPEIGDYDNDSIPDLMVKFDRASVISYIYDVQGIEYGNVTLTITGRITHETGFKGFWINEVPFEGADVIKVSWGYTLTIWSSPSGVTFAVDNVSHTTPSSRTYGEGASVSLIMPEIYTVGDARYYWNQWSDGKTSRSRTVTMDTDITLTAYYAEPYYELIVASSPITGITFTVDGVPKTTLYTEWLPEGSYSLIMPETHNGYVWSHWLEDGDPNRTKTITLPGTTWTGVFVFAVQPHGPEAKFEAIPDTALTGESIKFDASASLSGWNGTHTILITEYRWDFADGNQTTTSTPIVYHSFSSSGIYYVTLTVYAPGATPETDSTTKKVTITAIPVGGYSFPINLYTTEKPLAFYLALVAILTTVSTAIKRKTHRRTKR